MHLRIFSPLFCWYSSSHSAFIRFYFIFLVGESVFGRNPLSLMLLHLIFQKLKNSYRQQRHSHVRTLGRVMMFCVCHHHSHMEEWRIPVWLLSLQLYCLVIKDLLTSLLTKYVLRALYYSDDDMAICNQFSVSNTFFIVISHALSIFRILIRTHTHTCARAHTQHSLTHSLSLPRPTTVTATVTYTTAATVTATTTLTPTRLLTAGRVT